MKPAELLQQVNALHQTTFTFLEKYPDGEQGAFIVADHLGRRLVLKWAPGAEDVQWDTGGQSSHRSAAQSRISRTALSAHRKNPRRYLQPSKCAPIRQITPALVPRLLELNSLQAGRAIPGRKDWHQEAIKTVLLGGDGYCFHMSLQEHSRDTANLLRKLQVLVMAHQDEPHRTDDIVHGDFQHANILIQDEQISGIVDWDGCGTGDCVFDIVTLLFYAYDTAEVRELLWDYAIGMRLTQTCEHLSRPSHPSPGGLVVTLP